MFVLRKIKYKKGRKVQSSTLEYTGIHKDVATEMQMFVYDLNDVTEYQQLEPQDIDSSVFLSLPYEIQREIELTMKLRNQRKVIKKSLFLNDSLSYFENSKQYLDNKK